MTDKEMPGDESQKIRELEQEKTISEEIVKSLKEKTQELEKNKKALEESLTKERHEVREVEQEREVLKEMDRLKNSKINVTRKRYYTAIAIIATASIIALSSLFVYQNMLIQENFKNIGPLKSQYVIQNLRGDVVNTWVSWNVPVNAILYVKIVNSAELAPDKITQVKDAILSEESLNIDDSLLHKGPSGTTSTYYKGWKGAIEHLPKKDTLMWVPENYVFDTEKGIANITIDLVPEENADGLSGYTKSISDNNQILKSTITIYNAKNLSNGEISTITRHEFGHALGLAHSTAPEDLMAPVIQTQAPYVSDCDLGALVTLYDGGKKSQIVCEK